MPIARIICDAVAGAAIVATAGAASAATKDVPVNAINASGIGTEIGTITFKDTPQGMLIEPKLSSLPPGPRGFHIHENANCGPGPGNNGQPAAGMAAGGHYDPGATKKHRGPYEGDSHLGDMPVLVVDKDGTATLPGLAPRLKVSDLTGRAVMIHVGSDNYDDTPAPLGGGGGRIACGVVK
jgi:superoxide dismutase, Cu-Zn family